MRSEFDCEQAEIDEQWSCVGNKSNSRMPSIILRVPYWVMCLANARMLYSTSWKHCLNPLLLIVITPMIGGAYEGTLKPISMRSASAMPKRLNARIWISELGFKRLTRKAICFSKLETMHDIVIGLLINKVKLAWVFMHNYSFNPLPDSSHQLRQAQFTPSSAFFSVNASQCCSQVYSNELQKSTISQKSSVSLPW